MRSRRITYLAGTRSRWGGRVGRLSAGDSVARQAVLRVATVTGPVRTGLGVHGAASVGLVRVLHVLLGRVRGVLATVGRVGRARGREGGIYRNILVRLAWGVGMTGTAMGQRQGRTCGLSHYSSTATTVGGGGLILALDVVGERGGAGGRRVDAVVRGRGRRGGVVGRTHFLWLGRVLRSRRGICGGFFRLSAGERVWIRCGQT